jgi:hypothetical protein
VFNHLNPSTICIITNLYQAVHFGVVLENETLENAKINKNYVTYRRCNGG